MLRLTDQLPNFKKNINTYNKTVSFLLDYFNSMKKYANFKLSNAQKKHDFLMFQQKRCLKLVVQLTSGTCHVSNLESMLKNYWKQRSTKRIDETFTTAFLTLSFSAQAIFQIRRYITSITAANWPGIWRRTLIFARFT